MAKTETAAYGVERVKLTTSPVVLCRFFHVKKAGDGTDYAFSQDFTSGPVTSATKTLLQVLRRVVGNAQTVDPVRGSSSYGTYSMELVDVGGDVLRQLSNPQKGLGVALSAGGGETEVEANADTSGYPPKGTVEIDSERIRYTARTTASPFKFTGITRAVDGTALAAHSVGATIQNGEQIRKGQRCQILAGYAAIAEADYMSFSKMEVAGWTSSLDGVTFIVTVADIQRFMKREVFTGATRDTPVTLTGNPVTLALQVLTSTGAGTNGTYDVLAAANGLGVPQALVDIVGLESLRDTEFVGQTYDFKLTTPESGKEFVEREFWLALNCVPIIKQDGKYSAKRIKPAPAPADVTFTLTADEIIRWHWVSGERLIVNQVDFRYDWNLADNPDFWSKRQLYTFDQGTPNSVDRYGKQAPLVIESKGIKTSQGGQTILDDRAFLVGKRFAEPPRILEVEVFYLKHIADVIDPVKVTHSQIQNLKTGLRGLTNEVFEIIDMRPLFLEEGRVVLALMHTGAITLPSAPSSGGAVATPSPIRDTTAPAVPTGLALTPTSQVLVDGTFIGILDATWTANTESDLSHYIVRWRKTGDAAFQDLFTNKSAVRQIIRGLSPNTSYDVQVAAVDFSNNASAFSATVAATTAADPGVPAVPTGLAATSFPLAVSLSWILNAEDDIAYYDLQRADDSLFTVNVKTYSVDTIVLVDKTNDTTTRFYKVRAVRRSGVASAYSASVSAAGGQVDTGNLANLAVTVAKIADLAVETAKIKALAVQDAKIDNLTITTGKHSADAITQAASFLNDATVSIALSGTSPNWQDVDSLTITTNGGDVYIWLSYSFRGVAAPDANTVESRFVRDTTVLEGIFTDSAQLFVAVGPLHRIDSPASGTYTYKIQVRLAGGTNTNADVKLRRIIALVRKK